MKFFVYALLQPFDQIPRGHYVPTHPPFTVFHDIIDMEGDLALIDLGDTINAAIRARCESLSRHFGSSSKYYPISVSVTKL